MKEIKYQILGVIISIVLIAIGVIKDIDSCLFAGIIFMLCNVGGSIGVLYKKQLKSKLPYLILAGLVLTAIGVYFAFSR